MDSRRGNVLKGQTASEPEEEWIGQLTRTQQLLIHQQMREKAQAWQMFSTRLNTLSPLRTLARGYSVCKDSSGDTVTDASKMSAGDEVETQLSRGWLACEVLKEEIS